MMKYTRERMMKDKVGDKILEALRNMESAQISFGLREFKCDKWKEINKQFCQCTTLIATIYNNIYSKKQ